MSFFEERKNKISTFSITTIIIYIILNIIGLSNSYQVECGIKTCYPENTFSCIDVKICTKNYNYLSCYYQKNCSIIGQSNTDYFCYFAPKKPLNVGNKFQEDEHYGIFFFVSILFNMLILFVTLMDLYSPFPKIEFTIVFYCFGWLIRNAVSCCFYQDFYINCGHLGNEFMVEMIDVIVYFPLSEVAICSIFLMLEVNKIHLNRI